MAWYNMTTSAQDMRRERSAHACKKKGVFRMLRVKKTVLQLALLVIGAGMLCFGALRGEADTVLAKAIRLCLECVGIG